MSLNRKGERSSSLHAKGAVMEIEKYIFSFAKSYGGSILLYLAGIAVIIYLARSFYRHYLISQGQARLVLSKFDKKSVLLHRFIKAFIFFIVLPFLILCFWPEIWLFLKNSSFVDLLGNNLDTSLYPYHV